MKDRDMYYGNYGYSGFVPMGGFPNNAPLMMQPQMSGGMQSQITGSATNTPTNSNYMNNWYNDINDRVDRLERQVKRLDQRLTRLETPYANNNYNNEPDNNMYMM